MVALVAIRAQADRLNEVRVRTWDTAKDEETFPPELADPDLGVPWLATRPSFGIAFSGGGTRSATATLGQLRALDDLGWLDQARYLTANSGGSWAVVPYTYLPDSLSESAFLGAYVPPESIDDALLESSDDRLALGTAIHGAGLASKLGQGIRGDEAWSGIVGSIFLDPFGLHDNERLFTFHRAALERILDENPNLRESDFYTVERSDRPYMIVVGTMLARQTSVSADDYFPVEMTPLYTGIRQPFNFDKDGEQLQVGGGYIESFGYDSYAPDERGEDGRYRVRLQGRLFAGDNPFSDRYRFTLSDVVGVSSAAPLVTATGADVPNLVFPELRHWAVDREFIEADGGLRRRADEYQHGDGVDMDNLGLMPLLVRGVENILVFVNAARPFTSPSGPCTETHIVDDVVSLFRTSGDLVHNVVIENGDSELDGICRRFAEQKTAQEPLVHCQTYQVVDNLRYGIRRYRPDICWAYLDRVEAWIDAIPSGGGTTEDLQRGRGDFDNFPHYGTLLEHAWSVIDLDRERVNALSNLTAWTVYESSEVLRQGLEGAALPPRR